MAPANVRGLPAGETGALATRSFLHADPYRNIAMDHAFVAAHAADFHARFVRNMRADERATWSRGVWRNEWHYGRRGWWWELHGVWYGYPMPVWPYPLEVVPLTVYETPVYDGPDLTQLETGGAAPGGEAPGSMPPDAGAPYAGAAGAGGFAPPAPANTAPDGGVITQRLVPPPQSPDFGRLASEIPPLPPAWEGSYRCGMPTGYFPVVTNCQDGDGWRFEAMMR